MIVFRILGIVFGLLFGVYVMVIFGIKKRPATPKRKGLAISLILLSLIFTYNGFSNVWNLRIVKTENTIKTIQLQKETFINKLTKRYANFEISLEDYIGMKEYYSLRYDEEIKNYQEKLTLQKNIKGEEND